MCGDNKNLNAYTVVEIRVTLNMHGTPGKKPRSFGPSAAEG
jgi:hypothetical protein